MLKVEIIDRDSLSQEDWQHSDYGWLIRVYHNEDLIATESDCGEPEDNSFVRDYKWIKPLLEKVYELGLGDGRHEVMFEVSSRMKPRS